MRLSKKSSTPRTTFLLSVLLLLSSGNNAAAAELEQEEIWAAEIEQLVRTKGIFPGQMTLQRGLQGPAFYSSLEDYFGKYDGGASHFIPNLRSFKLHYEEGRREGLGLSLRFEGERCCAFTTKPNSPAERAGLPENGMLLSIDGEDISRFTLTAMAALLEAKGKQALLVQFTERPGLPPDAQIITPAPIENEKPQWVSLGELRAIRIPHFQSETRFQVEQLLAELAPAAPLIIDLRNNSGGSSHSATRIACLFMKRDTVVYRERFREKTSARVCRWPPVPELQQRRVLILQDKTTASSAELFITAMKNRKNTITLGEQSYGKGVKSTLLRLSNHAGLLLSTSEYLGAEGEKIHGAGIPADRPVSDWNRLPEILREALDE